MNSYLSFLLLSLFLLTTETGRPVAATTPSSGQISVNAGAETTAGSTLSIPIDTANRMIQSYLDGIDYTVNTNALRSWTFNADTLRAFLDDNARGKIVKIKFMLAHSLEYIHAGHEGQRPPVNSHVLTMIIVGIDAENNYIYNADNMPFDHCQPCPVVCLSTGTGSSDLLVAN